MSRRGKVKTAQPKTRSQFDQAASLAGLEVHNGKAAIKGEYRAAISTSPPWAHTESIDLDAHFKESEPNACRWDYGVGIKRGSR